MNKHRGEVEFEADGKTYTLRYSIDAICEMEAATGRGFFAVTQELSDANAMQLSTVRAVLWAGLREHHPDVTLKEAGDLIVKAGGIMVVIGLLSQAITLAFPETEQDGKSRPRKGAGTGTSS